ncbi:MAG: SPOR domain-containing protein [Pseudomonadota bacterium]|nr:SPOR domain-containing protein [Pseudomonadota bacterium]
MSRDYRYGHNAKAKGFQRRSQQKPADRGRSVGKIWLIGTLVSVNFLGGFLIVQHFMSSQSAKETVAPSEIYAEVTQPVKEEKTVITVQALAVSPAVDNDNSDEIAEQVKAPKYSFYKGLKESEVIVDAVPISVQLDSAYYILAGTFGSEKVALNEQKRLARLGQEVKMGPIKGKTRTYYRLSVGPYTDRLIMNAKRNELRRLGVDTLLLKSKTQ